MAEQKTITIIDTFGFFFRSFYALPPLRNQEGFPTGLLTGFLNFIASIEKDHATDYLVFALDAKGPSFRMDIDANYKAHREEAPQDLKLQLPIAIEWIKKMGFATLEKTGYEADDVIATVAKLSREAGLHVTIVSHDKDLFQLIDDGNIVLLDAIKRKKMDETACIEKYGITPKQFIDYQALLGDSADNVPGVKGIGKVTAEKLLKTYKSLDTLYANIDTVEPKRIKELLITYKEDAIRSKQLVSLADDVFSSLDLHDFDLPQHPFLSIVEELHHYEMHAQLRVLKAKGMLEAVVAPVKKTSQNVSFEAVLLDTKEALFEVIEHITPQTRVAFDTETTGLDVHRDTLVGFSFAFQEGKAYYVPFGHHYLGVGAQVDRTTAKEALERILQAQVVGHNLKFDLGFVERFLGTRVAFYADTMIMAWLVDSSARVGLDALAQSAFGHTMISFSSTVKKGENFSTVPLEEATRYAAEDAYITWKLYDFLLEKLHSRGGEALIQEAKTVEFPFVRTLLAIEQNGIKVDVPFLSSLQQEFKKELDGLVQAIYELAGESFNINSPKQLGGILFEKLSLPVQKKGKTGYSTDEKVLHALIEAHPLVPKLLEYREAFKLYSTYIEPLLALGCAHEQQTIFTSFLHTGTATGRLSSKNPNLQNIPTRSEQGRRIRSAFIAREGCALIGIDYSQIELRLLAHYSQDPVLVESFQSGKDIHLQTAVKLFGEEEAAQKRHIAKTVNFGLLYGMGANKLGDTLGIANKEAKAIIEAYFASFPTVKTFLSSIAQQSEEQGYVQTLLGRRRWFDYDNAPPMMKAAYKREAVNTVFQGSAADLIKLSMNKIQALIEAEQLPVKMLLQIHDELIFEAPIQEANAYAARFASIMEGIFPLSVPLACSVAVGSSWGALK